MVNTFFVLTLLSYNLYPFYFIVYIRTLTSLLYLLTICVVKPTFDECVLLCFGSRLVKPRQLYYYPLSLYLFIDRFEEADFGHNTLCVNEYALLCLIAEIANHKKCIQFVLFLINNSISLIS